MPSSFVVSEDGRHVFYAMLERLSNPECRAGGTLSANEYDVRSVGIVALRESAATVDVIGMPRGCGDPALTPGRTIGAVVACRDSGYVALIAGDGTVRSEALGGTDVALGFTTTDGDLGVITWDGDARFLAPGAELPSTRLLPDGTSVPADAELFSTADGRTWLPYTRTGPDGLLHGLVAFRIEDGVQVVQTVEVGAAEYALPTDEHLIVSRRSGALELIELSTGEQRTLVAGELTDSRDRSGAFLVP